jgi:hypothetical protein
LRHPDFKQPFYLHIDTSGKNEYAIAYASKSLNRAEQNYSVTELEYLAIVWAIEHFRQYFGTAHFYIITDHSALQWLKTTELKGK